VERSNICAEKFFHCAEKSNICAERKNICAEKSNISVEMFFHSMEMFRHCNPHRGLADGRSEDFSGRAAANALRAIVIAPRATAAQRRTGNLLRHPVHEPVARDRADIASDARTDRGRDRL
jgi:hypothetical protein